MKALFLWMDGPLANRTVKLSGPRIELGPSGEESLPVPGATQAWAVVEYDQKHFFLTDLGTPGGLFVNDSQVRDRVEVRAGAILRFGTGPKARFGFEIEPQDLLAQAGGAEYSPSEAMRRMEGGLAQSAVGRAEVHAVEQRVEERGKRRWGMAILMGVLGTCVGIAITYVLVKRQEKKTEEKIQQLSAGLVHVESDLRKADVEFRRAVAAMPKNDEAAKERIAEIEKRLQELRPEPEKNREEIARLEEELKNARAVLDGLKNSERRLQEVYDKALASLIFLWVEFDVKWQGQVFPMAGCGTGFLIDDRGTVVTAKHVVHPWKYADTWISLYSAGVDDWKVVGSPRIQAWQAGDAFVLETKNGQPLVKSTPRWSTKEGTLTVRKVDDHLVRLNILEFIGDRLYADIEDGFEHDVAILEVKGGSMRGLPLASDEDVKIEKLRPLTPILVAGFPLGNTVFEEQKIVAQPTCGYVRKVERLIFHSVPSCPGNSGGPVLNEDGKVIGIVNGAYREGQNMNVSCSASRVRRLLEK